MNTVLTIAGSDCSGGAGIQADLKTITAFGMYGMTAVTALTVQNTLGVADVWETPGTILSGQLHAVFSDIFPDSVKIGMLPSASAVSLTAEILRKYSPGRIVLDPVMVSTSGRRLMDQEAAGIMMEELIPQATVLTPNIPEAVVLLERLAEKRNRIGREDLMFAEGIRTDGDMERAASILGKEFRISVLLKGGHAAGGADDCLWTDGAVTWFRGQRLDRKNTHGTGCTLSCAIACGLAAGLKLEQAVEAAKRYLTEAMRAEPGLGHGTGPLNHCFSIDGRRQWRNLGLE